MKHLYQSLRQRRGAVFCYLLLGVATSFLNNFCARYFQRVIDGFTEGTLTAGILALYGAALTVLCLLNYLDNLPTGLLSHGIYLGLKVRALEKMRTLDYTVYRTLGTGLLVQRIENGAMAGKGMLFDFWFELARSLAPSVLFSMLFIWQLSPTVMLVILGGYVVVFCITQLLLRALYRIKERILTNEEQFNHTLVRGFMELVVFRLYKRFGREVRRAEEAGREIVGAKVKMTLIHEAFFTLFALLVIGIKLAILVYGWTSGALTIGQVVALLSLADYAYTPIAIFNVLYVQYKLDKTAFARFSDFLDAADDPQLDAGEPIEGLAGALECRSLCFHYAGRAVLSDFCLHIAPGERVALAGASGAGKSTLVGLLTGLLKPSAGQILIDGRDLSGIRLNSYYDHIAYVPQDAPIFDGTLRENLAFDRREPDEALLAALEQAGLLPLYRTLPDGLETPLGERGVRLSGGERQRLALARLWFSKAGLVLLDEATSALDAETERLVLTRLLKRLEGRTLVVIAHRLRALQTFDRIVVLRDGAAAEQGGWQELLDGSADFRRLVAEGDCAAPSGTEPERG